MSSCVALIPLLFATNFSSLSDRYSIFIRKTKKILLYISGYDSNVDC